MENYWQNQHEYQTVNEMNKMTEVDISLAQLMLDKSDNNSNSTLSQDNNLVTTDLYKSQQTVRVKLYDDRIDPNNPFYSSLTSFEDMNLTPKLLRGIYSMNFAKPSKIQERALSLLLTDPPQNMIGQSQNGTGKTAAFILAILQRTDFSLQKTQGICLVPTRELARQVVEVIEKMGQFTGVTTCLVIRDSKVKFRQIHEQIVVGTPGSVLDVINRRGIELDELRTFVLDEADNLLEQGGLGDQSIRIKRMVRNPRTQFILFSATFPERVHTFANRFAPNANKVFLKVEELSIDGITQIYMDCQSEEHKYEVLCNLYSLLTVSQSIIFCKFRETAHKIAMRMEAQGHAVRCLHGGMSSTDRDQVMDDFRRGRFKVLISTNVVSRGIDILQVSLVINYDMPSDHLGRPDPEAYIHRIGRTGRFGRAGVSVSFAYNRKSWEEIAYMEDYFKTKIRRIPTEDWERVAEILKSIL
ncbi:DEAD-domain-containing protein [Cokeromyces recurvatus]|uniref:DEAD-domain-containing protein n=1 Tax=Cokeromyces recurvatus TaxID=90255 RepID=UPI0022201D94|nr:DEAD-domain-containing protein [Cokeromyces recurvatus]KAI7898997.1 DEAD-domain-containing protein [Cokeromyces recurvatus]